MVQEPKVVQPSAAANELCGLAHVTSVRGQANSSHTALWTGLLKATEDRNGREST